MERIRIDKFISVALGISRNDAKLLVKQGAVSVDGDILKRAEDKVFDTDIVQVNGRDFYYKKYIYLVMNKPEGYLSASKDKKAKTVIDLVDEKYKHYDLFTIGRLDKNTTGLLLITNDGDFAHKIISPKSNIHKVYFAELDGDIKKVHIDMFESGVVLADGTKCLPAKLTVGSKPNEAFITIQEGKYHQVKRMFGTIGIGVNKLSRLSIGEFSLPKDLLLGESRELLIDEFTLLNKLI